MFVYKLILAARRARMVKSETLHIKYEHGGHAEVNVILISLLSTLSNMVTAYFAVHMAVYLRPYHDSIM